MQQEASAETQGTDERVSRKKRDGVYPMLDEAGNVTGWRARWVDAYGERRSGVFKTQAQAKAARRRALVEADDVRSGKARPKSEKTVKEASAEWLASRPATRQRDDEPMLRMHILPFLGKHRLAEVNDALLQRFVRHLEGKNVARVGQKQPKKLQPKTIKNVLVTLCKMLGDLGFPTRIKYKVQAPSFDWLRTPEEVGRYLDACQPEWFKIASALAVHTGMRLGEVGGLRRESLHFDQGLIRVERSYDGPTKAKHLRWVPLSPALASMLKPWLLKHPGPLVVTKDGKPLEEHTSLSPWARRASKRAGLQPISFHALRHTVASHLLLSREVSLAEVGKILGHVSPATTARYAHLDSDHISRQPRTHLHFPAGSGKVLSLAGPGSTGHEVATREVDRAADGTKVSGI